MSEVPNTPEEIPPVIELGGAIGRFASLACRQGQHDLCKQVVIASGKLKWQLSGFCECRCHQ